MNSALLAIKTVVFTTWIKSAELHQDLSNAEAVGSNLATLWVFGFVIMLGQAIGLTSSGLLRSARYVGRTGWRLCVVVKRLMLAGNLDGGLAYNRHIQTFGMLLAMIGVGYGLARWTA